MQRNKGGVNDCRGEGKRDTDWGQVGLCWGVRQVQSSSTSGVQETMYSTLCCGPGNNRHAANVLSAQSKSATSTSQNLSHLTVHAYTVTAYKLISHDEKTYIIK